MGIIRGKVVHDEWTTYENGRPVCGVGYRGYWVNNTVVDDDPFEQRPDGSWYNIETGLKCKTYSLKELFELEGIK